MNELQYAQIAKLSDSDLVKLFGSRDTYVYQVDVPAPAIGSTSSATFIIQGDSAFLWQAASVFNDAASNVPSNGSMLMAFNQHQITDLGSGRALYSAPVPVLNVFGIGAMYNTLPTPRYFRPNTQVRLDVTSPNATQTTLATTIRFSFIGVKLFSFN